jgi:drug/metabolite transporter (DMT)-like permease
MFFLSAAQMLTGGVAMAIIGFAKNEYTMEVLAATSSKSWFAVAYLIVLGSCVGFTSYTYLLRNVRVSLVATYAYVNPAIALSLVRH